MPGKNHFWRMVLTARCGYIVDAQHLLCRRPRRGSRRLWRGRAAGYPAMHPQRLLRLGSLLHLRLLLLRQHGARGCWRRLQAACGKPGSARRHRARGTWLRGQLRGRAGRRRARWTLLHALRCTDHSFASAKR